MFSHVYEDQVVKWDDEVQKPKMLTHYLHVEVREGLVYRVEKGARENDEMTQLLIPQGYGRDLLRLAHTLPMGGI